MTSIISEEELNEVAGGFDKNVDWDFVITCSCGYSKHFTSFKDATKALIDHVGDGAGHNCHIDVNRK